MKGFSLSRNFLISLVAFLVVTTYAWAQATTELRGTVTDPSGAAVTNASVTLKNTDTNLERKTVTATDGSYGFHGILPGNYQLTIEAQGFKRYVQSGIALLVNLPATIDVKLGLGAVTEIVEITSQAPALNTTDASLGQTMDKTEILSLPLQEGNVVQLLTLQPGVVYTTNRKDLDQVNSPNDTRSGAVNGERSDQSNVTLDGVDVNDQGSGFAFTSVLPVTVDSVQEFRVTTSNYDAAQGRSAGGQVALVTTGGTNNFHGDLYEFNRTSFGESNDFFVKKSQLASGEPNRPPGLVHNVFGGSLGGPFLKDRFFFFVSYEGQRRADASSELRQIPSKSLRDGVIFYQCDSTSPTITTDCPGGSAVTGLSGTSYTIPKPVTLADGTVIAYNALSPSTLASMDPLATPGCVPGSAGMNCGPSAVTLAYFNSFPLPNDTTIGDGFNYTGFRFAPALHDRNNWYIARLDYKLTSNGNHILFWRGSVRNDSDDLAAPYLPSGFVLGGIPQQHLFTPTKGFALGYTAVLRPNLVNNFRYGLTRQSEVIQGNSNLPWNTIRGINGFGPGSQSSGINYANAFNFPVHNIVDDLSWIKGKHTLGFGTNVRLVYSGSNSQLASFSSGTMNASWLTTAGIAGTGTPFDPAANINPATGNPYPGVDSSFANSYDFPLIGLIGMVSEVNAQYNFTLNPKAATGTQIAPGAPIPHRYALYEYELYAQDSWKIKPNFTFNYGVRYLLMTPPWETNGQEVAPFYLNAAGQKVYNLGSWFQQRGTSMRQGIPSNQDPVVSFDPAGRSSGRPDLWPNSAKNFAPRISFAYSPRVNWLKRIFGEADKSVIRAGFGMYYDHFGQGMLSSFTTSGGSFGLSSLLINPAGTQDEATSPRVTGMNVIPQNDNSGGQIFVPFPCSTGGTASFPCTFPNGLNNGGFCICWGLDSSIKAPYSYALDLSVQRQLPGNFSLEVGYVGHLGHRLLMQGDLAMPKDLFDPKNGMDYFTAITTLAKIYRAGVPTDNVTSATLPTLDPKNGAAAAQFWADMFQPANAFPGGAYALNPASSGFGCVSSTGPSSTTDAVQAIYDLFCPFSKNETTPLFILDYFGITNANNPSGPAYFPAGGPNSFFNAQYSSLYAWRSIGFSHYHAGQFTLHKRMSHGVRFDLNYTFSRSIDLASDAERVPVWGGLGGNIINAWSPFQLKAVSDFDLTHQINGNWTLQLPFGQGRHFRSSVGKGLDAIIGGWDLSGVSRWSSGFPVNVSNGFQWPTNWQLGGQAILTKNPSFGATPFTDNSGVGQISMFKNNVKGIDDFRSPFPGEAGQRNAIRGDGFLNTDMSLTKNWKMPYKEAHRLVFRWDVFNVFNTKRFDVQSAAFDGNLELDISSSFGNYTHVLTQQRVMQFGLRYEF
jgi:carboxypeptidase family protein